MQEEILNIIKKNNDTKTKYMQNVDLKDYNSFKISKLAKHFLSISNVNTLIDLLKYFKQNNISYNIIGNGTNILIANDITSPIIKLKLEDIKQIDDNVFTCQSGVLNSTFGYYLAKKEKTGFEQITGIPGTIGGAIYMNAGCYNMEVSDNVLEIEILDENLNRKIIDKSLANFSYRNSIFKQKKYIILSAKFCFDKSLSSNHIIDNINLYMEKRKNSQPLELPNAGSFFKRIDSNIPLSKLIDDANLKGLRVGNAQISTKHAGFIVNLGGATPEDILILAKKVEDEIFLKYGIKIQMEVEILR